MCIRDRLNVVRKCSASMRYRADVENLFFLHTLQTLQKYVDNSPIDKWHELCMR